MGTIKRRPLKLYMRRANGKLIAGSAQWRAKKPAGDWVEITQAYQCCTGTTTTIGGSWPVNPTCYNVTLNGSLVASTTWSLVYCGEVRATEYTMVTAHETVCLAELPVLVSGVGTYSIGAACTTSTTSTSTSSTTTTTTTVP